MQKAMFLVFNYIHIIYTVTKDATQLHTPSISRNTFNLPTNNKVAAILPNKQLDLSFYNVLLYYYNKDSIVLDYLTKIPYSYPTYLPLYYVLLFLFSILGQYQNIKQQGRQRIANKYSNKPSLVDAILQDIEYVNNLDKGDSSNQLTQCPQFRYYLFKYNSKFLAILRARCLFKQFIDNAQASINYKILDQYQYNQETIYLELYSSLIDTITSNFNASHIS